MTSVKSFSEGQDPLLVIIVKTLLGELENEFGFYLGIFVYWRHIVKPRSQ